MNKEKDREQHVIKYNANKKIFLCVNCDEDIEDSGFVRCIKCRVRKAYNNREYRRRRNG